MYKFISVLFLFPLFFLGCDAPISNNGFKITKQWQVVKGKDARAILTGERLHGRPSVTENGIITYIEGLTDYDKRPIMLNKTTGEMVWRGDDRSIIEAFYLNIQKDNVLVINGSDAMVGLDIRSGKTLWRNDAESFGYGIWLNSIGDYYFTTKLYGQMERKVIRGRISDGFEEVLYTVPPVNEKLEPVILPSPIPYRAANGDTMLVIQYKEYDDAAYQSKQYVALYNVSQKRQESFHLVEERNDGAQWGYGEYHDGYLITYCHREVVSIDPRSGVYKWRFQIPGGVSYEPFTTHENKLIVTSDDGYIYAIDMDSGKALWTIGFRGGMAKPFVMDGVVYVTGRAQGHLYAVDLETGKKLLDLRCPETDQDDAVAFTMPVTGANGVIYLDSHASTYAYKVER